MKSTCVNSVALAALLLILACSPHAQTPPQNAAADLGYTSWQLVQFQGSDDTTLRPANKAKYTLAFGADGRVSVRIDCNHGSGTWQSPGPHQLAFGPLALTRAMCPPAPLNERITKDWEFVRSYTLKDGHLFLSLMADGGHYEFEPISLEGSMQGAVTGTATYRERMALPPDAVFEATLEDVSKADAASEVIGLARIEGPGNPPIRFEIRYDPARIHPSHRYVIRARVLVGGTLFFTTDQQYPVLTAGQGHEVEVLLRRAGASSPAGGAAGALGRPAGTAGGAATEPLENTYWKLTRLGDAPVTVASQQREPHLIFNSETRRAAAYQAYYEHMPLRHSARPHGPHARLYDCYPFGTLLQIYMLDDRQYRTPQACPRPGLGGSTVLQASQCAALRDPTRTLLGAAQETWLMQMLGAFQTQWNVLAQQTLMAQLDRQPGSEQAFWTDGWDGYPAARAKLLTFIADTHPANPLVVGGDVHSNWVCDLKPDFDAPRSPVVATELCGTSITSQAAPQERTDAVRADNPHIKFANSDKRGYLYLDLTPERCTAYLRVLDSVKKRTSTLATLASFAVENGRPGAVMV